MGCGVTISKPSSDGVMRCRLVASAKNAKTVSRGSGRDIEVCNVWISGIGTVFEVERSLQRLPDAESHGGEQGLPPCRILSDEPASDDSGCWTALPIKHV